jgi:hypothetical protein
MNYILVGIVDCYITPSRHGNFQPQALLFKQEDIQNIVVGLLPHADKEHVIKLNSTGTGSYFLDGIPMPPNISKAVKYLNQLVDNLAGQHRYDYIREHNNDPRLCATISLNHLNVHDRQFMDFFEDIQHVTEINKQPITIIHSIFIMYVQNFT